MRSSAVLVAWLLLSAITCAQRTILHNVHFPYDGCEMTESLKAQLDSIYDHAPKGCIINLGIVGQIKNHSTRSYSNSISEKRANNVRDYLVSRELNPANISILEFPYGKNRLTTGTDKQKKNTILLYEVEWKKPVDEWRLLVRPDTNAVPRKLPQHFAIYRHNGNTITGKEGTIITFTDDCFQFPEDDPMDCEVITIELIECFNLGDIVTQGLHSKSGIRMLSTGGMIYIMALCNGKQLIIKNGKTVQIKIPTYDKMKGMELFRNKFTPTGNDWFVAGQKDKSDTIPANLPRPDQVYTPEGRMVLDGVYTTQDRDSGQYLDHYIFDLTKLGWINCDRFYEVPSKITMNVSVDTTIHPLVRMVFKNIYCVMPGDYSSTQQISFAGIPENYVVTLVAYAERNKKLFLGTKEVMTSRTVVPEIEMEQVTQTEFREKLKELNK